MSQLKENPTTGKHLLLENDKENKFRIRPDIVGYKNNKANFIAYLFFFLWYILFFYVGS